MVTTGILSTSIILQFAAAFLALKLIKVTGNRLSWTLISSAITLMGVRRCISLFRFLSGDIEHAPDYMAELTALLISTLMVVGIFQIHVYFQQIKHSEEERKRAESLLARFGRILDNSFNEIYVFSAETSKFIQVNVGARKNLKYSMEELSHLTPVDLKPEFTEELFEKLITPLKNDQKPMLIFETIHKRKDGTFYPVEVRLQLMKDESPPVFVAIIQDISKQKKDKEKLINFANDLSRSNKELEDFAFIASHDLQEPLRKITTFGDRLINDATNLDENHRDYIERMQKSAYRMKRLIEDLLHYSRISVEPAPFKMVDLGEKIKIVCKEIDHDIQSAGGVVNITNLPTIEGNASQLNQLFTNLILNSFKYKREDTIPTVNISARKKDDDYWEIAIEDNGIGFDEKYADRIFQPFQRLHGKSDYHGSGIGLSICKKIVAHHKGTLSVKSSPGEGTTFTISFPAKQLTPLKT